MAAFGAVSGVISLIDIGVRSTRVVLEEISHIQGASAALKHAKAELLAVLATLKSLNNALDEQHAPALPQSVQEEVIGVNLQIALKSCQQVCDDFSAKIRSWKKHSTDDGDMSKLDQVRIGLFGDSKIKAFTTQLGTCKATIVLTVTSVHFLVFMKQMANTGQVRSASLQLQEANLQRETTTMEAQARETNVILHRPDSAPQFSEIDEQPTAHEAQNNEAIDSLHDQQEPLERDTRNERANSDITVKMGELTLCTGSKGVVGAIGTREELINTNHDIRTGNIHAASNSKFVVGRANLDMNRYMQ